jgi:hypothetical protein
MTNEAKALLFTDNSSMSVRVPVRSIDEDAIWF